MTVVAVGPPPVSAEDIIRQVARFHRGVRSARVNVRSARVGPAKGSFSEPEIEMWLERPGRLATRDPSGESIELVCNRKTHFVVSRSQQQYVTGSPLGRFEELAYNASALVSGGWGVAFGPLLLCDDPYQAIMAGVDVFEYLGPESLGGVAAHHLVFGQANLNWEMWVAAEGDPLLLRLELDRELGQDLSETRTRVDYQGWQLNLTIPAETFTFDPPASFRQVTSITPR